MKAKFLIIMCLLSMLAGCGKSVLSADRIDPLSVPNDQHPVSVQAYGGGFFFLNEKTELLYAENCTVSVPVSQMRFIDDEPAGMNDQFDRYIDEYWRVCPLILFSDHLLYVSEYRNKEGEQYYKLMAMTKDGAKRDAIIDFDYTPVCFTAYENQIIVLEYSDAITAPDTASTLHFYDLGGKQTKQIDVDGLVRQLTPGAGCLYFVCNEDTVKMNLKDDSVEILRKNQSYESLHDNEIAYYELSQPFTADVDPYDIIWHSFLTDLETDEILFETDDEIIDFFDNSFIYTSSVKEEHRKYRVYRRDGSLYREFSPAEELHLPFRAFDTFHTDCFRIAGIANGNLIGTGVSEEDGSYLWFACNVEEGSCHAPEE